MPEVIDYWNRLDLYETALIRWLRGPVSSRREGDFTYTTRPSVGILGFRSHTANSDRGWQFLLGLGLAWVNFGLVKAVNEKNSTITYARGLDVNRLVPEVAVKYNFNKSWNASIYANILSSMSLNYDQYLNDAAGLFLAVNYRWTNTYEVDE